MFAGAGGSVAQEPLVPDVASWPWEHLRLPYISEGRGGGG